MNAGTYAFAVEPLFEALAGVRADNSQGEYYLGDVLPLLRAAGHRVVAHLTDDEAVGLGINTRVDLARVEAAARARILERHMLAGVTVRDPASTHVDAGVSIGEDTTLEPYTFLRGAVSVGRGCTIGPMTTLIDSALGDEVLRPPLLPERLRGREPLHRGPVHPPAPRGAARGGSEGRRLRRDQELEHRGRA